jgi:hypothetical protein
MLMITRLGPFSSKKFYCVLAAFDLIPGLQRVHIDVEVPACSLGGCAYPYWGDPVFRLLFVLPVVGSPVIRVKLFKARRHHSHIRYISRVQSEIALCSQNNSHNPDILLSALQSRAPPL